MSELILSASLDQYLLGLACILIPLLLSLKIYPTIIYTVKSKNLLDEPGNRSLHQDKTPTMGGVGIFVAFALTLIIGGLLSDLLRDEMGKLMAVMAGCIILLFLGIKDDLIALSPTKKITGQIMAAAIVVFLADIRILSFYGLFGISELPYPVSVVLSIFVFLLLINAYNLIDGIDGLAGSITLLTCITLGVFFALNGDTLLFLVSAALTGATIGFLYFNLSDKRKLFMGDSGSLFMGFLLAFIGISYMESNANSAIAVSSAPVLIISLLSFPVLDTMRVSFLRLHKRTSLFKADRNHIHHRLLGLGLSHKQATTTIVLMNILIIALVLILNDLSIHAQLLMVIVLAPVFYFLPFAMALAIGLSPVKIEEGPIKVSRGNEKKRMRYSIPNKNIDFALNLEGDAQEEEGAGKEKSTTIDRAKILEKSMAALKQYKSTN